jgi:VanZ family protein
LTLAILALIVYGSLFPFRFYDRGDLGDAVQYLLATSPGWTDRSDVLSNILLYLPLGLFGARALENLSAGSRVALMAMVGGTLSVGIELTQFFDLSRASALSDVTANFAGAVGGALIETAARAWLRRLEWRPFAIILIAAQLGAWLYPYVPSFHALRSALDAVRHFDAIGIYRQAVFWLAIAMLLEELIGAARAKHVLAAMAAFVILTRLAIPDAAVTGNDLSGALLGVLGWALVLSNVQFRAPIIAGLFTLFVIVDGLRPFTFLPSAREFGWTPFLSFIEGPRGNGSRVFLEKTFTYGALLWLFIRSGLPWLPATVSATSLVFVLRMVQIRLPGRSAEITDVLMVLILAAVVKALAR